MTIIFANAQDDDCQSMHRVWGGFPDATVIEITPQSTNWEDMVDSAIANEEDILIFIGYGTEYGLLFPDFNTGVYILHENNKGLIRAKNVICVWCYAANFCEANHLNAFATSMFISNVNEAYDNGIYGYDQEQINSNSVRFDSEMNELLGERVPLNEWAERFIRNMDANNDVDMFNRQGLTYIE